MTRASHRHAQGAALLLVLWLIALLTALVGAFALTARIEGMQGRVLHRGVIANEVARAAGIAHGRGAHHSNAPW